MKERGVKIAEIVEIEDLAFGMVNVLSSYPKSEKHTNAVPFSKLKDVSTVKTWCDNLSLTMYSSCAEVLVSVGTDIESD